MNYYLKYLKYKNKYINLSNIINKGGASVIMDEESKKQIRNERFKTRAQEAKILVIGASIDYEYDIYRWSQIDPNFIGISAHGDDPISDLGSWNNNENYWIDVFNILENRTFDSIYIDRGTVHHMGVSSGMRTIDLHGRMRWVTNQDVVDISKTAYGKLIKFIYERNITNRLYIYDDAISTNVVNDSFSFINPNINNDEVVAKIVDEDYKVGTKYIKDIRRLSTYLMKYFRCCDTPTYIERMPDQNGEIVKDLFVSWTRKS